MRIHVIGDTGAGKTTLAAQLASHLHCPHIELDALHWGPDWTKPNPELFRQRVSHALQGEQWVVDGNYNSVRDIVWARANLVVWLDYPLAVNLWRLWRRTLWRMSTQQALWEAGNRESWRNHFLTRDSLFLWLFQTHGRRRRTYNQLSQQPEFAHIQFRRLCSPAATRRWLNEFRRAYG